MMRGPRGLLLTLLGAAAIIAAAFLFGFRGQKDDAETSRAFLTHAAAGEMDAAYALLHVAITGQYDVAAVADMLAGMDAYTEIRFPGISFSTENGRRFTELIGTGTTATGCESALEFELRDGAITFFDIQPLCRRPDPAT